MKGNLSDNERPDDWVGDPTLTERARIVLVLYLSKKSSGELVRILMDWLVDSDLYGFCHRYLGEADLDYIEGKHGRA